MGKGYLKVEVTTAEGVLPISNAEVICSDESIYLSQKTNSNGATDYFVLSAPDKMYSLAPYYGKPAYSVYNVSIRAIGYITINIHDVEILDTQIAILPVQMEPILSVSADGKNINHDNGIETFDIQKDITAFQSEETPIQEVDILIPPIGLLIPEVDRTSFPPDSRLQREVFIPEYITVHLGVPNNASARNVRVKFIDYIKNVTSSEIYATWPENSIIANVYAIVTFALNRVYTEWYRSRGFQFDITNSTAYDQYYRDGAQIYENISQIVDEIFNVYAHRYGFSNPFATKFCNGTTAICDGLSQWGTVTLARQGMTPLEILRYYYPNDLILSESQNIMAIVESFPGYALRVGSQGAAVQRIQNYLNRIRINFPLIPQIPNPNGTFEATTETAVRTFQRSFDMDADGVVGRATWNKINFIFVGVTRLAELDGEGNRISIGQNPPDVVLSQGSRGGDVLELQFILNSISPYYPTIPFVIQDSVFDSNVKNAVIEFQKTFGLTPDGDVGPATWNKLYSVYKSVRENVIVPPIEPPTADNPTYPGTPLRVGSRGADVRLMQTYLNTISIVYPVIPQIDVDGIFGVNTEAAVIAFQQKFFLPTNGIIDSVTWYYIVQQYMFVIGASSLSLEYPGIPLRLGSTGSSVRLIQQFLSDLRSPYPSLPAITIDGMFGPNTVEAVTSFQRLFGLMPDGIVGPETWYEIVNQRSRM